MGHRHVFNASQIFDTDNEQGWNHAEQHHMPIARAGASESSSVIHPVANTSTQDCYYPSRWNPAPRPGGYYPAVHNGELPSYQPQAPGPSRDPFQYQPAAGNFHMMQDSYSHFPSSSNPSAQSLPGPDSAIFDQTMGSSRVQYKRKTPGMPPVCDRGSTSRWYDAGSSSDLHLPSDPWQEKHITGSRHTPWEPPSYGVNNLSIGNEGMVRNVRSRPAVDLETNPARTHLPSNSLNHPFPSRSSDQFNPVDFWGHSSNAPSSGWNRSLISSSGHGLASGTDSSFFSHDPIPLNSQNSHHSGSVEIGGYQNDLTLSRNPVPQNININLNQSVRGARSGYVQRSIPTHRASSSSFRQGHMATPDEGPQMVAESYPSRYPRAFPTVRWRNIDRNGRNVISSDRYRPSIEDANSRLMPEGLVVDYSTFYGSRTLFDQHRDMRLDIDNMSYEDLLALGERIGHVNTGLSDGLISKCMTESIYCSSDVSQDDGTCVICLEEYKNMDDVGTLKECRHDFHVSCIRKWLSMKNSCPICKAAAVNDDGVKEK